MGIERQKSWQKMCEQGNLQFQWDFHDCRHKLRAPHSRWTPEEPAPESFAIARLKWKTLIGSCKPWKSSCSSARHTMNCWKNLFSVDTEQCSTGKRVCGRSCVRCAAEGGATPTGATAVRTGWSRSSPTRQFLHTLPRWDFAHNPPYRRLRCSYWHLQSAERLMKAFSFLSKTKNTGFTKDLFPITRVFAKQLTLEAAEDALWHCAWGEKDIPARLTLQCDFVTIPWAKERLKEAALRPQCSFSLSEFANPPLDEKWPCQGNQCMKHRGWLQMPLYICNPILNDNK